MISSIASPSSTLNDADRKSVEECKRSCPVVKVGKLCIEVSPKDKIAFLSEELCIGCGICVKKCPFDALTIINLPKDLEKETTIEHGAEYVQAAQIADAARGTGVGFGGHEWDREVDGAEDFGG